MLPLKRYLEMLGMFFTSVILMQVSTTWWWVYVIGFTVINVLYVIMSKTVMPLMKLTFPKFFGDILPFDETQAALCVMYVFCLWAPAVTNLLGGALC